MKIKISKTSYEEVEISDNEAKRIVTQYLAKLIKVTPPCYDGNSYYIDDVGDLVATYEAATRHKVVKEASDVTELDRAVILIFKQIKADI